MCALCRFGSFPFIHVDCISKEEAEKFLSERASFEGTSRPPAVEPDKRRVIFGNIALPPSVFVIKELFLVHGFAPHLHASGEEISSFNQLIPMAER